MTELLPKRGSVFTRHWFYTSACCELAADTFLHPIHFHTPSGTKLYIPLTSLSCYKINPFALRLQASHIILIKYRQRSHTPHPLIYPIYENVCRRYVPPQSVAFVRLIVAFMDPFDIQLHVLWYHAIDTKHVPILVKFGPTLSISVLRHLSFFTKNKWLSHPLKKVLFPFFSHKLNGQPALRFDKGMDVRRIYCMIPRAPGFLG
jgi:hypothetical protein